MLQTVMVHDGGVIVAIGIVGENVRLMKDEGQPLNIQLGKLLTMRSDADAVGTSRPDEMSGELSLLLYYGDTHMEIVDRWNEELTASGLHLPDRAAEDAVKLDEQLRAEGLI